MSVLREWTISVDQVLGHFQAPRAAGVRGVAVDVEVSSRKTISQAADVQALEAFAPLRPGQGQDQEEKAASSSAALKKSISRPPRTTLRASAAAE